MLSFRVEFMLEGFVTAAWKLVELVQSRQRKDGVFYCWLRMAGLEDKTIPELRLDETAVADHGLLPEILEVALLQQVLEGGISHDLWYNASLSMR